MLSNEPKEKTKRKGKPNRRTRKIIIFALVIDTLIVIAIAVGIYLFNQSDEPSGSIRMVDGDGITLFNVADGTLETIPYESVTSMPAAYSQFAGHPILVSEYPIQVIDLETYIVYRLREFDNESDIWRQHSPVLSPDSSSLVFVQTDTSYHSALFHADLATSEINQLTDFTNDIEPDWSPDRSQIIFTTSRDGFQELYSMSPDGSNQRRLTQMSNLNDLNGKFSPDGTKIAYMTNYSVSDGSGEIWLMDADGDNKQRLTNDEVDDREHVWSPDGRMLAWVRGGIEQNDTNIMVYDLESGEIRQLTQYSGYDFTPKWAPDSQWIAFSSDRDDEVDSLYLIRPDGTDLRATGLVLEMAFDFYRSEWIP